MIYTDTDNYVLFSTITGESKYHCLDINNETIIDYSTFDDMLTYTTSWSYHELTSAEFTNIYTETFAYNASSLLENYPIGAYFTENGISCETKSPCENCTKYCGKKQCWGFARYGNDVYNHCAVSFGNNQTRLISSNCESGVLTYKSADDLWMYISGLHEGDNFQLYKNNGEHHSFILLSIDDDHLYTYEANVRNETDGTLYVNIVRAVVRSFTILTNAYSYIKEVDHHSYGNATSYNLNYHKLNCSKSNCNAYYYEKHVWSNSATYINNTVHKKTCLTTGCVSTKYENHNGRQKGTYYNNISHLIRCDTASCSGSFFQSHEIYVDDLGNSKCSICMAVIN